MGNTTRFQNHTIKMDLANDPKRVVLPFHVQHELEEAAINQRFFALYGPDPPNNDFYSHLIAPNESSQMHIVLDFNCKLHPIIDNSKMVDKVFNVKKRDDLYVIPQFSQNFELSELVNSKSSTVLHANMLACAARGLNGAPTDHNLRNWTASMHSK